MEQVILKTNHLTKRYGHRAVVENLSMTIHQGDIYGFIGKNGAGKTTLIRMVTGLAAPSDGSIQLFGSGSLLEGRRRIGTVIEAPAFYPGMTARENIIAFSRLQGLRDFSHVEELLELVGLDHTGKKKCRNFSLGMKQRLAIAIALIGDPKLLILDEPTNGLDPEGMKEVRDLILKLNQERGITVLVSSHILGELSKFATRYGIIHHGKLIEEFTEEDLWRRCARDGRQEIDLEDYFLSKIGGKQAC
ncbi:MULTISPECIES: ABC transporter ATP-binding protein [Faecalicatena]|nr:MULTISPECIES: ABC transporter ATP-binding protein [Faecalicatena]